MKRRVYGEELASEPSQFLNEMPLELMEDLSRGNSWLSFARGSTQIDYEHGEYRRGQAAGADDAQSGYRKEKGNSSSSAPRNSATPAAAFNQLGKKQSKRRLAENRLSKVQSPKT